MAAEIRQELRLTQQLVMTPQLQMAIKLLQLSRLELVEQLREEIEQNPVLEETINTDKDVWDETPAIASSVSEEKTDGKADIDWQTYLENYHDADRIGQRFSNDDNETQFGSTLTKKTTLTDYLLWQLRLSSFTAEEVEIGTFIIGNIDDIGYLRISAGEIAQELSVNADNAESILKRIQEFDPIGVGARDLKECLLIQAKFLPKPKKDNINIIEDIINYHLNLLEKKDYKAIAKALNIPISKVIDAIKIISNMEPRPGRAYGADDSQIIIPDVYIQKVGSDYVVLLNEDGLPKLKISPYYKDMLSKNGSASDGAKSYIQERLRSAAWLIKSIHQRQKTIYKVTESIIKFQREFLDKGVSFLKILILRDIAQDIGMHESTVSRVTNNKYAHTPQGIFELKYFFSSGISGEDGIDISAESVKQSIKKLVISENPKKPLSDEKIVQLLKDSNIDIARRTVAKYREAINIRSSSERRQRY